MNPQRLCVFHSSLLFLQIHECLFHIIGNVCKALIVVASLTQQISKHGYLNQNLLGSPTVVLCSLATCSTTNTTQYFNCTKNSKSGVLKLHSKIALCQLAIEILYSNSSQFLNLLKWIHKNNLLIISSIISLQSRIIFIGDTNTSSAH